MIVLVKRWIHWKQERRRLFTGARHSGHRRPWHCTKTGGPRSRQCSDTPSRNILPFCNAGTWQTPVGMTPIDHRALWDESIYENNRLSETLTVCALPYPSPALVLPARIPHDNPRPILYLHRQFWRRIGHRIFCCTGPEGEPLDKRKYICLSPRTGGCAIMRIR